MPNRKKQVTYDDLRACDKETLVQLVLSLRDKFNDIHKRTKQLNLQVWRYRDQIAAMERRIKPKRKRSAK